MFFHWQNLNEKRDGMPNGSGFWHGRCWWHLKTPKCIGLEWHIGPAQRQCHAGFSCDDEGWDVSFAVPFLVALYWSFNIGLPTPKRKCIATWDGNREFWLTDERECQVSFYDWTLRINPWSKKNEWASDDPWWVKGLSLNIPDLLLGRTKFTSELVKEFAITIPMPEKSYSATVKVEHCIWKRPRSPFKIDRHDATVDIPGGIPFPGKGENSWDCGMDGLFGYGCSSTKPEDIIAKGVQSVMESRRRYAGSVDWVPEVSAA